MHQWRSSGERLVLLIDANENVTKGLINDMVTGPGLEMREAVIARHRNFPLTPTWMRGSRLGSVPIDGVFVTPDLPIESGTWLAFSRAPWDHRTLIIDFLWRVLLGDNKLTIVRPPA